MQIELGRRLPHSTAGQVWSRIEERTCGRRDYSEGFYARDNLDRRICNLRCQKLITISPSAPKQINVKEFGSGNPKTIDEIEVGVESPNIGLLLTLAIEYAIFAKLMFRPPNCWPFHDAKKEPRMKGVPLPI